MRLAIIRQRYAADGRVERVLEDALGALLERDIAISLYTREWPVTRLKLIEPVLCNPYYVGKLMRDVGFARAVGTAIGAAKADLVESHEPLSSCDVYRADEGVHAVRIAERRKAASKAERLRLALSPHERYLLVAERRMFASPWLRAVLCASKMVRAEIRERYGLPATKLPVVYPAVDNRTFSPAVRALRRSFRERNRVDEAATILLVAGAEFGGSGALVVTTALAAMPRSTHFIVAVPRADAARGLTLVRAYGATGRVTLVDPGADMRPFYGAADALLVPAPYDPSPAATLEAMACALPVVVSAKSGAAEVVTAQDAGFACALSDVPAWVASMRRLLDATTRARLGANACNAVQRYAPEATALRLVLLYRNLFAAAAAARAASPAS